jgi:hypothetical protein
MVQGHRKLGGGGGGNNYTPVLANLCYWVTFVYPIVVNLMMWVIRSSETSVLTTATLHNIREDILYSHCRENLKSYIALTGWAL